MSKYLLYVPISVIISMMFVNGINEIFHIDSVGLNIVVFVYIFACVLKKLLAGISKEAIVAVTVIAIIITGFHFYRELKNKKQLI